MRQRVERMTVGEFKQRWMQARALEALQNVEESRVVEVMVLSTFAGRFFTSWQLVEEQQ